MLNPGATPSCGRIKLFPHELLLCLDIFWKRRDEETEKKKNTVHISLQHVSPPDRGNPNSRARFRPRNKAQNRAFCKQKTEVFTHKKYHVAHLRHLIQLLIHHNYNTSFKQNRAKAFAAQLCFSCNPNVSSHLWLFHGPVQLGWNSVSDTLLQRVLAMRIFPVLKPSQRIKKDARNLMPHEASLKYTKTAAFSTSPRLWGLPSKIAFPAVTIVDLKIFVDSEIEEIKVFKVFPLPELCGYAQDGQADTTMNVQVANFRPGDAVTSGLDICFLNLDTKRHNIEHALCFFFLNGKPGKPSRVASVAVWIPVNRCVNVNVAEARRLGIRPANFEILQCQKKMHVFSDFSRSSHFDGRNPTEPDFRTTVSAFFALRTLYRIAGGMKLLFIAFCNLRFLANAKFRCWRLCELQSAYASRALSGATLLFRTRPLLVFLEAHFEHNENNENTLYKNVQICIFLPPDPWFFYMSRLPSAFLSSRSEGSSQIEHEKRPNRKTEENRKMYEKCRGNVRTYNLHIYTYYRYICVILSSYIICF